MQPLLHFLTRGLLAATVASLLAAGPVRAAPSGDQAFFEAAAGTWHGPGRIVAGKYKGTRFVCNLTGDAVVEGGAGIAMDGSCRVGVFSQKMSAVISRSAEGYTGSFLDGAEGEGLDVTSGNVQGSKVVVGIKRKQLFGAMVANLNDENTMNVTVSVKVGERMIPVIGMTLARTVDGRAVGSIR